MSENNCFISQGEYGRKFIESIHNEIERIKTEKDNYVKDGFGRYNDISCKDLFVKPLEFLFKYASNDRVEYVMNYDNNLLYIRIKDLTPEEYAILKKYKSDRPVEDFAPIAYL